ncbi:DUF1573 domain-containing protein [Isosphaeraceae bacterium EP7]
MLRWILLALVVVGLTAGATVALQFMPTLAETPQDLAFPAPEKTAGPAPVVEVDSPVLTHDFGVMAQRNKGKHVWKVKNTGKGDLQLKKGPSTCSCTIANLKEGATANIKPGEETEVAVEWETREFSDKFERVVSIITNDPERPKLDFKIGGIIKPAIVMYPPDTTINFIDVASELGATNRIALTSPDRPDFKITKIVASRPDFMVTETRPLTEDELKSIKATSTTGVFFEVKLKPGMPIGPFREEIVLTTDHPNQTEIKLNAVGRSVGPISMVPERIRLLNISGKQGGQGEMVLWVRGRDEATNFKIGAVPENLKVAIDPIDNSVKGASKYRLSVKVLPGTPPGQIEGTIILKTDHPMAGELKVPVNVFVTSAG